jgi:plasmid stabilization system protein ParE
LVYRTAALRDLASIATYIERESQSRAAADAFVDQLTDFCEHLAALPGLMGGDRSELRPGYRSAVYGNYVIFLRYADENRAAQPSLRHQCHPRRA